MKASVDMLEDWIKKQEHFTKKNFDRRYLEVTIIICKGSVERAKERLDRACTMRTLMPHVFDLHDLRPLFKTDLKDIKQAILPKMTTKNERVYILRNTGTKFEPTLMKSYGLALLNMAEYLRRNDYGLTYYVVLDYQDVNLVELASKISLNALNEIISCMLDCCGFRIKAFYFISSSKLVELIVTVFKQVMSAKLGERIRVLKDRGELRDLIEKRILPAEYGGEEKSLDELHEDWLDVLTSQEHINYLRDIHSARTDESRRRKDKFNEQYMGMPGSFRSISLD
ncbi:hypothetical protein O0L34_g14251 [Tuta absoluta]|nr:hypothetical protein O0L34_g14251 [Tuta absoluta]